MNNYKQEFAEFLARKGALELKERKLKSGRISPYFINMRIFSNGRHISKLGYFYANAIIDYKNQGIFKDFNVVFGPSYAGIPLAVATAVALSKEFKIDVSYAFDRKENKAYGEKSSILGHKITNHDKILIVDDVFTTGKTKLQIVELIKGIAPKAQFSGLLTGVDRKETDEKGQDAIKNFENKTKIRVESILTIYDIIKALPDFISNVTEKRIIEYLKKYGVGDVSVVV